ncbi:hypothetical protein B0T20DRAFT_490524, partial [Sordaria brevicollis]
MQRWSFPSFRSRTTATATSSSPTSNQDYTPSAKYKKMEQTLRSRITKQKAKNEQTRKNIASLEAKSVYLRRLKQLEKEVEQLEKEGRELETREDEVRRVVDKETAGLENVPAGKGEERDGAAAMVAAVAVAVDGEEEHIKNENGIREEQNRERLRIKREIQGGQQDNRGEVKREVEVKNEPIEEVELLNGAAAWRRWSSP